MKSLCSFIDKSSHNAVYFSYMGEVSDGGTKRDRLARIPGHAGDHGDQYCRIYFVYTDG